MQGGVQSGPVSPRRCGRGAARGGFLRFWAFGGDRFLMRKKSAKNLKNQRLGRPKGKVSGILGFGMFLNIAESPRSNPGAVNKTRKVHSRRTVRSKSMQFTGRNRITL